ncbi:MAG TPA: sugar ABC transporter ATP-binding protein [Acetobacteraceae bacterium]|nr:sugar ABC transporter ATP-binding protein [Acetobacteraceae bacterium]
MAPAVEGIGLSRSFGGVKALANASFSARIGEVHALVGENGAGKSTMIKVLGGRIAPDSGTVRIKGQEVRLSGPTDAHALGAWTVFQELTLLPWMTVAENLLLAREPRGALGLIGRRRMAQDAEAMLAGLGIEHIDPLALIEDISLAERQIVEIVRAISHEPDILFLDEPTSSLVEREVAWLFGQIRRLRARQTAVVFTSHRWNEIQSIADRITIFRGGEHVGTFTEINEDEAVTLMTGQRVDTLYPPVPKLPSPAPAMRVEKLAGPRLQGASFTLHKGEVLGIGGLAGHGHRELFFMLFGAERAASGTVSVGGREVRIRSPRDAVRRGVGLALVPEDRKTEGLLLAMSVRDNLTLSVLRRLSAGGLLRQAAERRMAQDMVARLKVRTPGIANPVGGLSGGNQQKVLVGRWLLAEPQILLFYDVTRGVDIATKHEIYELMLRLAAEGRSILFYSSDAEELAHLCHRVLVLREGRIAAELTPPGITAEQIVSAAVRDSLAA